MAPPNSSPPCALPSIIPESGRRLPDSCPGRMPRRALGDGNVRDILPGMVRHGCGICPRLLAAGRLFGALLVTSSAWHAQAQTARVEVPDGTRHFIVLVDS